MSNRGALSASPQHCIGERVRYKDHQGREQVGTIMEIEAKWHSYKRAGSDTEPHVTYCVSHPTYRNNKHYTGECFFTYD